MAAPRAVWPSQCVASGQLVIAAKVFWEAAARAVALLWQCAGRPSLADSSGSACGHVAARGAVCWTGGRARRAECWTGALRATCLSQAEVRNWSTASCRPLRRGAARRLCSLSGIERWLQSCAAEVGAAKYRCCCRCPAAAVPKSAVKKEGPFSCQTMQHIAALWVNRVNPQMLRCIPQIFLEVKPFP